MRIRAESIPPEKKKLQVLCAFCFEDSNTPIGLGKFNKKIDQALFHNQSKRLKEKRTRSQLFIHIKKFQQRDFDCRNR